MIGEPTYYIPLTLRKAAGQLHRINITAIPHPTQFKLVKNWLWDTLTIDWSDIELQVKGEVMQLSSTIVVPLRAKLRIRSLMNKGFHTSLAICQGSSWYDLAANSGAPIHRPLRRVANRELYPTTPSAPFIVDNNQEQDTQV